MESPSSGFKVKPNWRVGIVLSELMVKSNLPFPVGSQWTFLAPVMVN